MNTLFKQVKKRKDHVWKLDTLLSWLGLPLVSNTFFCFYTRILQHQHNSLSFDGIELLALSDETILFTLTPGNDYFVLVFIRLTLGQPQPIH